MMFNRDKFFKKTQQTNKFVIIFKSDFNQTFGFYIDQQIFNHKLDNILFKLESSQDSYFDQDRPLGTVKFFEQLKQMEAMFSWYPIKCEGMEI